MHVFHRSDPTVRQLPKFYNWYFCYLHGLAEEVNSHVAEGKGWEWNAPDLFVADEPMPTVAGKYIANLYGREIVIVIAEHNGPHLGGRAAINEPLLPCYQHANTPEEWM